MTRLQD